MPISMDSLGFEGLRFIKMLNYNEHGKCQTSPGLFEVQSEKFKHQHDEPVLLLQYCKLIKEEKESAEEWMSHLRVKANKCEHKERQEVKTAVHKMESMMIEITN